MPQGIKGAPTYFQMIMKEIFHDLSQNCEVYIDDILLYAQTERELLEVLEEAYKRLSKYRLTANPKKTLVGLPEFSYLGFTITNEGKVNANENLRRQVFDYPKPVYKKQLKSFLGLANVLLNQTKV